MRFQFGRVFRAERDEQLLLQKSAPRKPRDAAYDHYLVYEEIDAFVKETADANPGLVTLMTLSTTSELRLNLNALKISSGSATKSVFFDCAMQGREWIAPPVCMRIIEEVIADPQLLELADWYIVPIANSEGYVKTWTEVAYCMDL